MTKPERARERYQLEIRLIEEDDFMKPGQVLLAAVLTLTRFGVVVAIANEFRRDSLPPTGPQPRIVTITERSTKKQVAQFAVEAGDDGQEIVHAINHEHKRHGADAWAEKWVHFARQDGR